MNSQKDLNSLLHEAPHLKAEVHRAHQLSATGNAVHKYTIAVSQDFLNVWFEHSLQ